MSSFSAVRERFHQAQTRGWFFPGEASKYLIDPSNDLPKSGVKCKEASVLFLIACGAAPGQLHVLITKRSSEVGSHHGK